VRGMTKRHLTPLLIGAYALAGTLAFGHSAANFECHHQNPPQCSFSAAIGGLFAGVTWPLYLSWVGFDEGGEGEE